MVGQRWKIVPASWRYSSQIISPMRARSTWSENHLRSSNSGSCLSSSIPLFPPSWKFLFLFRFRPPLSAVSCRFRVRKGCAGYSYVGSFVEKARKEVPWEIGQTRGDEARKGETKGENRRERERKNKLLCRRENHCFPEWAAKERRRVRGMFVFN